MPFHFGCLWLANYYFNIYVKESGLRGEGVGPKNIVYQLANTKAKAASLPRRKNALLDNGEEQRATGKNK